jgi:nickel-responsive transcriptional regulator NikR
MHLPGLRRAFLCRFKTGRHASGEPQAARPDEGAVRNAVDHAARDLSKRLVQNFHGHHDLSLATLHVHLDDDSCMEVTALKGASSEVQHFADHIIAERGVRYGRVVMIPTASEKKPKARKHGHHHD